MGRGEGQEVGVGAELLYTPTRLAPAPSPHLIDETLMRIARQLHRPSLEYWDGAITPHDIRRRHSRYVDTPAQQQHRIDRLTACFRALEAQGMIHLAHPGGLPADHRYGLTADGRARGESLMEADDVAAKARIAALVSGRTGAA
jgi:hypothetical protein